MHTVNNPASRLLIPVMQVMEKIMATVRLVDGVGSESSADAGDEERGACCGMRLGSSPGGGCEGVSEPTLADLETNSTNSILLDHGHR